MRQRPAKPKAAESSSQKSYFVRILIFLKLETIMEACNGVEREVAKVLEKFRNLSDSNQKSIDEALRLVRAAKAELENGKA